MRIVIPTTKGKLSEHFGHCEKFALIDVEEDRIKSKESHLPPPHEPGVIPKWLHGLGANTVIANGIGSRAIDLFAQIGIQVFTGAPTLTPEELVESYLHETLMANENLCNH